MARLKTGLTSVVIPCWNALELTRVCLERLVELTDAPFELIAVDSGSTDGTAAWLSRAARRWPGARAPLLERARVLRMRSNAGYSAAVNRGLAAARGRQVLLGNADAAVSAGWLSGMLRALRAGGVKTAAVSPCSNPPAALSLRRPWSWSGRYADLSGLGAFAASLRLSPRAAFAPADGPVPGFWLLLGPAGLRKVGGLDEGYGLGGGEDLDWQWRARQAGLSLGFAPGVYVHHVWSGSIRLNGLSPRSLFREGRRRFFARHPGARSWEARARSLSPG